MRVLRNGNGNGNGNGDGNGDGNCGLAGSSRDAFAAAPIVLPNTIVVGCFHSTIRGVS